MNQFTLDEIVNRLCTHKQRTTYGAVAGVLGTIARNVGNQLGARSPAKSFVVAKQSRTPTGYKDHELHPDLYSNAHVISSPDELTDWLHTHQASTVWRQPDFDKRVLPARRMRDSLPYDMGNAGDLLKHGILAEWATWWFSNSSRSLRYVDPFGGEVAVEPPVKPVLERLLRLSDTALGTVQSEINERYYGSAHVILRASALAGGRAEVYVSDRDAERVKKLVQSGLRQLQVPGFDASNAYTALYACEECDLLLVDPFGDFLTDEEVVRVMPRLAIAAKKFSVLLFALDMDSKNHYGKRYAQLRDKCLPGAWRARLPKLKGTAVRGEARYDVEVVLAMPKDLRSQAAATLQPALEKYCRRLGEVVGANVMVSGDCGTC